VAVYFFDSSALVERYAQEIGTAWVQTLATQHYVFLARITEVEVIAAIERRKRTGTLTAADAVAAIADFRTHLTSEYAMVDVSRQLVGQAADFMACEHMMRFNWLLHFRCQMSGAHVACLN